MRARDREGWGRDRGEREWHREQKKRERGGGGEWKGEEEGEEG